MPFRPVIANQVYFLDLLEEMSTDGRPTRVWTGDASVGRSLPDDPPPFMLDCARISIVLEGRPKFAVSQGRRRQEVELLPGEAIYWARHAWTIEDWRPPFAFLGIVYFRRLVRFLIVDHAGGQRPERATPWAYHTSHPIAEAGAHVTWALDALAGQAQEEPVLPLIHALVHLSRLHLLQDVPGTGEQFGKAASTWRAVQDYLHENYARPLTRDSVARALRVHPNYLSALCAREGGMPFHQALEKIRIERAQHFLGQPELKLDRIAELCGFSGTIHLARAFKRVTGHSPTEFRGRG